MLVGLPYERDDGHREHDEENRSALSTGEGGDGARTGKRMVVRRRTRRPTTEPEIARSRSAMRCGGLLLRRQAIVVIPTDVVREASAAPSPFESRRRRSDHLYPQRQVRGEEIRRDRRRSIRRGDEDDDDGRTRQTTARVGDPIATLPHDNGGTSKLQSRQALRTIRSICVYVSQYFYLNNISLNNRSRIIEITSRPFISPLSHLPLPLSAPLTIFLALISS